MLECWEWRGGKVSAKMTVKINARLYFEMKKRTTTHSTQSFSRVDGVKSKLLILFHHQFRVREKVRCRHLNWNNLTNLTAPKFIRARSLTTFLSDRSSSRVRKPLCVQWIPQWERRGFLTTSFSLRSMWKTWSIRPKIHTICRPSANPNHSQSCLLLTQKA